MTALPVERKTSSPVTNIDKRICESLLRIFAGSGVRIILWDAEEIGIDIETPPVVRLKIKDRATLYKLTIDPEYEFGEAYSESRLEIEGSLRGFLDIVYQIQQNREKHFFFWKQVFNTLRHWRHFNSIAASRESIHRHYDLGNDFYRLWLDERMVYSCAYFAKSTMNLEEAQQAKLDYVCRKLNLRPGETVVEVGGGWGGLALHIAKRYGCRVKSFNISREQIKFTRQRVHAEGLVNQVEIVEDDYRHIDGRFDVLVSLGMLEHVGQKHYVEFGKMLDRCLAPHGRALIQTIGQNRPSGNNPWIERRIFPGGHLPTIREIMDLSEQGNFAVQDIENLRPHYAKTLECWLERFEAAGDIVRQMFDERFVRMWRLYLTGSAAAFANGALQLFQILLTRGEKTQIPWSRREWHAS